MFRVLLLVYALCASSAFQIPTFIARAHVRTHDYRTSSLLSLPEDDEGKFERLDEMTSSNPNPNYPKLCIVFDPLPSLNNLSASATATATLNQIQDVLPPESLDNTYIIRCATPESPNLTVGELLIRIRTYVAAVPPSSRVIPSISSLPMPAAPPATPSTPIIFLSQFSPPEVQQVISSIRSLNEDFAFALEVQPALSKSVTQLLEEIRGDHANANLQQLSVSASASSSSDAPRDYDIAIGVGISIAGFVGAYACETFKLWKEGALYLPWVN
ncbi:hypothetical protein TL16_g08999 [Triparma laevis f. inornata]|uniref:Uncharacterized protein n=1 Tax=Triparma laevis f. inornata TaxID=1714386 RepID=A0A9W7B8R7_9STRA|nr:hypothetical protein TL16_g08999 [Triparma laevis f. inornata]